MYLRTCTVENKCVSRIVPAQRFRATWVRDAAVDFSRPFLCVLHWPDPPAAGVRRHVGVVGDVWTTHAVLPLLEYTGVASRMYVGPATRSCFGSAPCISRRPARGARGVERSGAAEAAHGGAVLHAALHLGGGFEISVCDEGKTFYLSSTLAMRAEIYY